MGRQRGSGNHEDILLHREAARWSGLGTGEIGALAGQQLAYLEWPAENLEPGVGSSFDLSERSMRCATGFCFFVGSLTSVIVRIGIALAGEHFSQSTPWSGF